jgi:hypothetical protein
MILYRPTGLLELKLVYESGLAAFPPRLPEQPIFYPVLNFEYARQIASKWNTRSEPYAGYVTRFEIDDEYSGQCERHIVGGYQHEELWIPSDKLAEFNRHILGKISIFDAVFGEKFLGYIGEKSGFKGKDALTQFQFICDTFEYGPMDPFSEMYVNSTSIFLNFPFWQKHDFNHMGINPLRVQETLQYIRKTWAGFFPETPLGIDES